MNAKIRILSLLVAAVMIFGCLPMTAFATGDEAAAEANAQINHGDLNNDGRCDYCGVWAFEANAMDSSDELDFNVLFQKTASTTTDIIAEPIKSISSQNTRPTEYGYGATVYLNTDPKNSSNTVLTLFNNKASNSQENLSSVTFTPHSNEENANLFVFEFDMYLNTSVSKNNHFVWTFNFEDGTKVTNNATYRWTSTCRLNADSAGTYAFATQEWVRVRIVADNDANTIKYYILRAGDANYNECVPTKDAILESTSDVVGIALAPKSNLTSQVYFDNIVCIKTTEDYLTKTAGEYDCGTTHTFEDAIANASAGQTVSLLADIDLTGSYVTVPAGVTLDLNGFNLTADGISLFGDAAITDSAVNKGSLVVPQGNFATTNATYKMLPIWNGEGYILTDVTPDGHLYTAETLDTLGENQIKAYFRPQFGDSAVTDFVNLLSDGVANNGLSWTVEIDCVKGDAVAQTISFAVPDASIGNIYTNYYEDNPPYITLTVGGAGSNFDSYSVRLVIESDCGITYSEVIGTYTPAVAE